MYALIPVCNMRGCCPGRLLEQSCAQVVVSCTLTRAALPTQQNSVAAPALLPYMRATPKRIVLIIQTSSSPKPPLFMQAHTLQAVTSGGQQLTPFIERLDASAVVEGWHNNVLEHIGGVKQENVSGGGLLLATYILQGVSGLLPIQMLRSAEYMDSLSQAELEHLLETQPGLAQTLSKSISSDQNGNVALKVVEIAFSWLAYEMQEADGCGRFVAYLAMAVLTLLEMPGLQPPNYELLTTGLLPVLRAAKRMAAGRAIYDCTACVTDRKPIEVVLMVIRRLAEVHQPAASLVCASGNAFCMH